MAQKSIVWKYFLKTSFGGKCKICNTDVKTAGNTTNLCNHLKRKHNEVDLEQSKGEPRADFAAFGSKLRPSNYISLDKSESDHEHERLKEDDPASQPSTSSTPVFKKQLMDVRDYFKKNTSLCSVNDELNFELEDQIYPQISTPLSTPESLSLGELQTISRPAKIPKISEFGLGHPLQPRIDKVISQMKSFEEGGKKSGNITNAIVYMIAKDNMPLNTTEKEGFSYFLKTAVPLYKAPGRLTLTRLIDQKYEVLSQITKDKLLNTNSVALTTDVWTDTLNTKSYLGITAHFIFEAKLSSATIDVVELEECHTSLYLGQKLKNVCDQWNLTKDKVQAIVTDNGANIVKAINDTYGKNKHLPCFAHTLNLVASTILNDGAEVSDLITKIKCIVTFLKQCVAASDELRKAQSLTEPLKLVQCVPTRWNSTYYMLERFVKLGDTVSSVLLKFPKSPPMLSASELETVRELLKILKPIEAVCVEACGEKYVTSSKVIPLVQCLLNELGNITTNSQIGQTFKHAVFRELEKRFGAMEQVHLLAITTILDPRFKRLHFKHPNACAHAIQKVNNLVNEVCSQTHSNQIEESSCNKEVENNYLWKYHNELVQKSCSTNEFNTTGGMSNDFKLYLNQKTISLKDDPVKYWIANEAVFPSLCSVAERYLPIVATSVPCERLFSKAGNIMTQCRSRLKGKRLAKLLFLNSLEMKDWHIRY